MDSVCKKGGVINVGEKLQMLQVLRTEGAKERSPHLETRQL